MAKSKESKIFSYIKVCDDFAINYHIILFFNLDEMAIPWDKITKKLDEMNILFGDEINDLTTIICIHGYKQCLGLCSHSCSQHIGNGVRSIGERHWAWGAEELRAREEAKRTKGATLEKTGDTRGAKGPQGRRQAGAAKEVAKGRHEVTKPGEVTKGQHGNQERDEGTDGYQGVCI